MKEAQREERSDRVEDDEKRLVLSARPTERRASEGQARVLKMKQTILTLMLFRNRGVRALEGDHAVSTRLRRKRGGQIDSTR